MPGQGPGLLEGFDRLDLVALDDLDAVAGVAGWEAALFTLFNGLPNMPDGSRSPPRARLQRPRSGCRTSPRGSRRPRFIDSSRSLSRSNRRRSGAGPSGVASSCRMRRSDS
jgi:hypothetical protein